MPAGPARARGRLSGPDDRRHRRYGLDGRSGQARVLLAAFAAYVAVGTVLQTIPPYLAVAGAALGSSPAVVSLAVTLFLAGVGIAAVPAGWLADRHGSAPVAYAGFAVLLPATFSAAWAPSLAALLADRVVAGAGAGALLTSALELLTAAVPPRRLGAAYGVFVAGLPVGTVLAFDVISPLAGQQAWRAAQWGAAAVAAACLLAYAWATRRLPPEPARPGPSPAARHREREGVWSRPGLRWLLALVIVGYALILAFITWAPTRVAAYARLSHTVAVVLASILLAIDIPAAPAWGWLSDRTGRRKPFLIAAFAVYGTGAALLPLAAGAGPGRAAALAAVITFMGLGCAMFFPASLAVLGGQLPPHALGRGFGAFLTAQITGMAAGPLLLGPVFTQAGTAIAVYVIAGLALASILLALPITSR